MSAPVGTLDGFEARVVPTFRADKRYLCPECEQDVLPGDGHVVAWPEHDLDRRRHLHRHCWRTVVRRGWSVGI